MQTEKGNLVTFSPAFEMLHEAAHAYRHFFFSVFISENDPNAKSKHAAEEQHVVDQYELPAALKLGEGVRHLYSNPGQFYYVNDVLSREPATPPIPGLKN